MVLRTYTDLLVYKINWSVFITDTEIDFCAVRTESLNISHVFFKSKSLKGEQLHKNQVYEGIY
jgi:hypothetical protein